MATYSKVILSGSTNGKSVKVAATSTPGTDIHTAVAGTADIDEIWLYCMNTSSAAVKLTIEWGGTTAPDDNIEVSVPAEAGMLLVIPGLPLNNSLVVKAFADTTNVLTILGFVNRITA